MAELLLGLEILWHISLSLLIEVLTLFTIVIWGVAFCHWASQVLVLVSRYQLAEIGETYLATYTVGILSAQLPESWRLSLTPSYLSEFKERKLPTFFGFLRILLIFSALVLSTTAQFVTYKFKYDSGPVQEPSVTYFYDRVFLFSLMGLTYTVSRVIQFYREFNRVQCQRESPVPITSPSWPVYLFYYFSLVLLNILSTIPIFAGMYAVTIFCDRVVATDRFTFIGTMLIGGGLGYICGHLQENFFSLDNHYQRIEPFFSTINWDSRLNLVVFTLLPLMGRWHYYREVNDPQDQDTKHNFILFCTCISTIILQFSKYHALFSYIVTRRISEDYQTPANNRVHPEMSARSQNARGTFSALRFWLETYFPLNLSDLFDESTAPAQDQGSISTGTCTSLMNRVNNNIRRGHASSLNSQNSSMKTPTCPRSPPGSQDNAYPVEDITPLSSGGKGKQVFITNHVEVIQEKVTAPLNMNAVVVNMIPENNNDEVKETVEEQVEDKSKDKPEDESYPPVKLKRCPSNLPIVQREDVSISLTQTMRK